MTQPNYYHHSDNASIVCGDAMIGGTDESSYRRIKKQQGHEEVYQVAGILHQAVCLEAPSHDVNKFWHHYGIDCHDRD